MAAAKLDGMVDTKRFLTIDPFMYIDTLASLAAARGEPVGEFENPGWYDASQSRWRPGPPLPGWPFFREPYRFMTAMILRALGQIVSFESAQKRQWRTLIDVVIERLEDGPPGEMFVWSSLATTVRLHRPIEDSTWLNYASLSIPTTHESVRDLLQVVWRNHGFLLRDGSLADYTAWTSFSLTVIGYFRDIIPLFATDETIWQHFGYGRPDISRWLTSDVRAIARQAWQSRDFTPMPILADALQDAGCDDELMLLHLRDHTATHCRGCWALRKILSPPFDASQS
jgi:hypothetical protein